MTTSDPKTWVDDYDREHGTGKYGTRGATDEVLGVLTGQVPVRSMTIAMRDGLSNDEIAAALAEEEGEGSE